MIRKGWTWVGVSAQVVGIEGGGNAVGAALAVKAADPKRYGSLSHPGDSYSYDIYSQAGAAIRTQAAQLLDGLVPTHVLAVGESQSAFRLTTYVNAVSPVANIFDGYLIHSRGGAAAGLSQAPLPVIEGPKPATTRTDLSVPVLTVVAETDVVNGSLGFYVSRQPDTDLIRTWEIAGTAHADVYNLGVSDTDDGSGAADVALFAALRNPPNSVYGGVITCDLPLNAGPHTYVLRSALDTWVRGGEPPVPMTPLALDAEGHTVVDEFGNALDDVRSPHLDAPLARLVGTGQTGQSFCGLFGVTEPFDEATLARLYPTKDVFVEMWNDAVEEAVGGGALLEADAEQLEAAALTIDLEPGA